MFGWFLPLLGAPTAEAFTTRVHIALANEIYAALVASGDGSIPLRWSGATVQLSEADARAIVSQPLAFRAGAIGPDNFVFPAMTDQTHALGLRPYDQCADLIALAASDAERAYALGCLLHGASDAVAHHWVNWLTGETFTLTPITTGRTTTYDNVARHIVAESALQEAWMAENSTVFSQGALYHQIPDAFVRRALVSTDSPVWQRMAAHALAEFEAERAAHPDLAVTEVLAGMSLGPSELVVLLPRYIELQQAEIATAGAVLSQRVATLQDPTTRDGAALGVGAGPDGALGTPDDETACAATCPDLYLAYFTALALLAPRMDAAGAPLPPAWSVIADELHAELDTLPDAYIDTVGALSAALTGPLAPGASSAPDPAALAAAQVPLAEWADAIGAVDEAVVTELLPPWLLDLEAALAALGVPFDPAAWVALALAPITDAIRTALEEQVFAVAQAELDAILAEVAAQEGGLSLEYTQRLRDAAPPGVSGTVLDHLPESGLWSTAFNLTAATLAQPAAVLPVDDAWAGVGGASFDASYTLAWTRAAACDEVAAAVFPFGYDLTGLLSVQVAGSPSWSPVGVDAPVECHDGDLSAFADNPTVTTCALTDLDALTAAPVGSLSRAFPPWVVGVSTACDALVVPGLAVPPVDPPQPAEAERGCASAPRPAAGGLGLAALGALLARRRRLGLMALAAGCASDVPPDAGGATATPSASAPSAFGADDALRSALGDTTWHADRVVDGHLRPIQLDFAAASGLWVEDVAPWGTGRAREMRAMVFGDDGVTVTTTVTTPEGWPVSPQEGQTDTWRFVVGDDTLDLTLGSVTETYVRGAVPTPTQGLTADARAFEPGSAADHAFCEAGPLGIDHATLFDLARGAQGDLVVGHDRVAGVSAGPWGRSAEEAVSDLPGFAATALDAATHYAVRYVGTIAHPGGLLALREADDSVEDGLWVWVGDDVGGGFEDLFLEVHGLAFPDATDDSPRRSFPAGPVPVEIIVVRCDDPLEPVDLQVSFADGPWRALAAPDSTPDLDAALFPPNF